MRHYMLWAHQLQKLIVDPTEAMLKLLDEYDDLVDVFVSENTTVIVIPIIHYEFYDTHPDGELGTVVYRVKLEIPEDAVDYLRSDK